MPSLLIRDIPKSAYQRIKKRAQQNRRSLSREALVMLERELEFHQPTKLDWSRFPGRVKPLKPWDSSPEAVNVAIDEGQE